MFCSRCGNRIMQDDRFCNRCGAMVKGEKPVTPQVNPVPTPQPVHPEPIPQPVETENDLLRNVPDLDLDMNTTAPNPVEELVQKAEEEPVVETIQETEEQPAVEMIQEPVTESVQNVEIEPMTEILTETAVDVAPEFVPEIVAVKVEESNVDNVQVENQNDLPSVKPLDLKKTSFGKKVVSIVLCLFMFLSLIGFAATFTVRGLLSEESVEHIAENLDVATLSEAGLLKEIYIFDYARTSKDAQEIYDEVFADYVKDVLVSYSGAILDDEEPMGITYEDYEKLLRKKQNYIEKKFKTEIVFDNQLRESFNVENIAKDDLKPAGFVVSLITIIGLLSLFVVLAVVLFVINKSKIFALWCTAVTISVSSILFILTGVLVPLIFGGEGAGTAKAIVSILFKDFVQPKMYFNGAIMLVVATVLVVVAIKLKRPKPEKNDYYM